MIFSSAGQVSVIAPYGISGKTTVTVQSEYQGTLSNKVTMPISTVLPAFFSVNSSGTGQGAFLSQDNSPNSSSHPAHPGDVLILFRTGEA
jgi:uncharacterized protein (TIGR03437 family)